MTVGDTIKVQLQIRIQEEEADYEYYYKMARTIRAMGYPAEAEMLKAIGDDEKKHVERLRGILPLFQSRL